MSFYKNKWFKLFLLLLVAGIIFFFSSQPASESEQLSGFFSDKVLYAIEKVMNFSASQGVEKAFANLDHYVRKFGHFFEFFILGLLAANFFINKDRHKVFLKSAIFCAVYAASDEFHQMFVPGRGPGLGDVLLDTVSAVAAIIIFLLINRPSWQNCDR